jgi:hypothetical protein
MDIKRKIEIVGLGIASISGHEDVDAEVRKAALNRVIEIATEAKAGIDLKVAEETAATLG